MLLQNKELTIRNAAAGDASRLCNWWNDGSVMAHAGFPEGLGTTVEEVKQGLLKDSDEAGRRLIMEADAEPLGEMNYRNVGNKIAEIGIKICEPSKQEKGYGTRLLAMLVHALFMDLGYGKIILDTNVNNSRAQHVYEKLGFRKIRVNKDAWKDQLGEWQSSVDYELEMKDFVDYRL